MRAVMLEVDNTDQQHYFAKGTQGMRFITTINLKEKTRRRRSRSCTFIYLFLKNFCPSLVDFEILSA